jgi:acetylglutamate kinase
MHMTHKLASGLGPLVIKYGGSAMRAKDGEPDPLLDELAVLHRKGEPIVLVHGGGPEIDRALTARGIASSRIGGLRVTDAATLEVTEAVLCGTLNKRLVRALTRAGLPAVGISGQDGATLVAEKSGAAGERDLGYVGAVVQTNPQLLNALLASGFLPVVSPIAVARGATHAYNVNADAAAGAIASALQARALVMLTDVPRLLRDATDPASAIDRLPLGAAVQFLNGASCRDGMRPKLEAAIAYVGGGAGPAYICATRPGAIAAALDGDATIVS